MIAAGDYVPPAWTAAPFALLLLAIAIAPLVKSCDVFWSRNRNKLLVALAFCVPILVFYWFVHPGAAGTVPIAAGWGVLSHVLDEAVLETYIPFIMLLVALYTISGGIQLHGDLPAHPATNTLFLAVGTVLANVIGTTGAAMLLIRPLLTTNSERKHVRHTVIFFLFLVCNAGGCLTPMGDPPLFLGYLAGVPFGWTLGLLAPWAFCCGVLLAVYYVWDTLAWRKEAPADIARDATAIEPLRLSGKMNFLYLLGVVAAVACLVPGRSLAGLAIPRFAREAALLALTGLSLLTTSGALRRSNRFTFGPVAEVAALFLGIFVTMQAPIELLRVCGPRLGLSQPWHFFWATGTLSSFLDNAPTYAIFFQAGQSLPAAPGAASLLLAGGQSIRPDLLAAISLGAVFMGANTYIGNGPNFMVKAIAEERGIRMPGFFGYMAYSVGILIPLFIVITLVFFR